MIPSAKSIQKEKNHNFNFGPGLNHELSEGYLSYHNLIIYKISGLYVLSIVNSPKLPIVHLIQVNVNQDQNQANQEPVHQHLLNDQDQNHEQQQIVKTNQNHVVQVTIAELVQAENEFVPLVAVVVVVVVLVAKPVVDGKVHVRRAVVPAVVVELVHVEEPVQEKNRKVNQNQKVNQEVNHQENQANHQGNQKVNHEVNPEVNH